MTKYYIDVRLQKIHSVKNGLELAEPKSSVVQRISGIVSHETVNAIYQDLPKRKKELKHFVVYHGSEVIHFVCDKSEIKYKIRLMFDVDCPYHLFRYRNEVVYPRV